MVSLKGLMGSKPKPAEGPKDASALPAKAADKKKEEAPFGYVMEPLPENAQVIEKYWVREPFAGVAIAKMPEAGGSLEYFVQEVQLDRRETKLLDKVIQFVSVEVNPLAIGKEEDVRKAILKEARRILDKYSVKYKQLRNPEIRDKIFYYLERDLLGYGPIHAIMQDWRIEDISCDGVMAPIYVWHRRYESVPTNIHFVDKEQLDDFIVKLAHKSGKHVSSAFPIVDAMIFGKHRLAASFREEVSPKGSTFTIRKFREEPYSVIDLMNLGTINDEIAAYFWLMMENRASMLVIGGTAAGKTTMLNAIAGLIKPGYKVVTVEETAEINIPTENWVQFTSRESYGLSGTKIGEVSLFDLVKTSLRYRPDFLIVGEVRGEEAFVLFQAVATGHGGLCLPPWEMVPSVLDGSPMLSTIEELYRKMEASSGKVQTDTHEILAPKSSLEVPSYDGDGNRMILAKVGGMSKRDYDGQLLKLRTRGGGEVTMTEDHPVLVLRGSRVTRVPARAVKLDDLLLVSNSLPFSGRSHPLLLDLIQEISERGMQKGVVVKGVKDLLFAQTKGQLRRVLGATDDQVDEYRKKDYLPLARYLGLQDERRSERRLRFRKSSHEIPSTVPVSRELCRLIGFYLSGGHATEHRVDFSFNSKEISLIEEVKSSLESLFRVKPMVSSRGNSTQIVVKDRLVGLFFTDILRAGRDSYTKAVPQLVFGLPDELVKEVVDAYYLGDGLAYRRADGHVYVSAVTISRELAHGIYYLMLRLGYHLVIGRDLRKGSFQLTLGRGSNLDRFLSQFAVGRKLGYHTRLGTPATFEQMPLATVSAGTSYPLLRYRTAEGNAFASNGVLKGLGIETKSAVTYAEVVSIEAIPYKGPVYDFVNVGDTHNFIHGFGVVTSNCTIHGESFDSAIKRLTSPPMNVAESYIPLMHVAIMLERVMLPRTVAGVPFGRRITTVWEVEDFNKYVPVFEWSPTEDLYYNYTKRSVMLHRFAYRTGRSFGDMLDEIQKRRALLRWLQANNVRNVKEVFKYITEYYVDPKGLFRRLNIEIEPVREAQAAGPGGQVVEVSEPKIVEPKGSTATVPTAPPLKFLESGSFKILKSLSDATDPMDQEALVQSSGMDASEFEKILGILTKIGHVTVQQKSDKGGFKSMVQITPQGKKAYAQLSKKSSEL